MKGVLGCMLLALALALSGLRAQELQGEERNAERREKAPRQVAHKLITREHPPAP